MIRILIQATSKNTRVLTYIDIHFMEQYVKEKPQYYQDTLPTPTMLSVVTLIP